MKDETPWRALDFLSPQVRALLDLSAATAYRQLVVTAATPASARDALGHLGPDSLLATPVKDPTHARAMLAGLWLWHDALEEAHEIAQALPSATGSFWHAIMHRREGDFSNAKYWYARCRQHPALEKVPGLARHVLGDAALTGPLHAVVADGWDPGAFVDAVEAVHRTPDDPLYATAVRLQRLEWEALFDHCARKAAGGE